MKSKILIQIKSETRSGISGGPVVGRRLFIEIEVQFRAASLRCSLFRDGIEIEIVGGSRNFGGGFSLGGGGLIGGKDIVTGLRGALPVAGCMSSSAGTPSIWTMKVTGPI